MSKSIFSDAYSLLRTWLVKAREKKGLTQADVATKLGKPQSYVSKYERGERRLDVVEFLEVARVLGVEPYKILKELEKLDAKNNT
ncbi:MAG: helix-turn-helix transcriptional regulator [Deltaproteobacteria bacterium]|nr:helix-turn-helix transcriptional regulator [Deltaproteobacteria bacterium]